ncbi:uncharacterized membrane protein YbhN (UPF0104 family) [Oikeobacillus pervagus]|uniref:Phosphatidylglycerol lysyltransferase n=1 Tax=Oikeobacillus pervagus TaxID=1325931 RepID=A0AAJ1T3W7_9BACI|nr:lysylphosphatidylglycerol synthase transmembrane domain-containing protein [Oikeobacillus pervagus]MDQ0215439.1 uncharacterized membrane protein YbhN (UPF0104 family) [Oikeobacillus pervagus]
MKNIYRQVKRLISFAILILFFYLISTFFQTETFLTSLKKIGEHPLFISLGLMFYFISFLLKGIAWKWYVGKGFSLSTAMIGIWYSLLVNHLLPIKVGDLFRSYVFYKREKHLDFSLCLQSVVIMRLFDIFSLIIIVSLGLFLVPLYFQFSMLPLVMMISGGIVLAFIIITKFPDFFHKQYSFFQQTFFQWKTIPVFFLIFISWLMEAAVLMTVVSALGSSIHVVTAIWVNSITIIGQTFQMTPGGIANYETIMSLAMKTVDFPVEFGMITALISHGLKFLFSFFIGFIAWMIYPITFGEVGKWQKERRNEA